MLHLFNPENDLALAANVANYTPPRPALRLARAGAVLPLWYGESGDMVITHGVNAQWYDRVCQDFGIPVRLWDHQIGDNILNPSPWGWSLAAKHHFLAEGLAAQWLPTDDEIGVIRQLSHRRTSVKLAHFVLDRLGTEDFTSPATEVADHQHLESLLASMPGGAYLKQPWSSSGRGVVTTRSGRDRALRFGRESIAKQGSVMVEPAHKRALDFAMIFACWSGKCRFDSTSVFVTDDNGAYSGNLLATEPYRRAKVLSATKVAEKQFDALKEALRLGIESMIAPYYDGIVGVDMLVTTDGRIDPVVEVNVRKTMGYVANRFSDKYLAEGSAGMFTVSKVKDPLSDDYIINDHRIARGTLQLTPPNPDFSFLVNVTQV